MIIGLFLFMGAGALSANELTVAVSANAQFAFEELTKVFEQDRDIAIKMIIGSSGQLTAQIVNGAPFDVFVSADKEYPYLLHKKGLTYLQPEIYAYGALILWSLKKDLDLSKGLAILSHAHIERIAIADPKTAPYGRAAVKVLKEKGLLEQVRDKLVYGQSVAQTNHFIVSGASDIGLTAQSVLWASELKRQGQWKVISSEAHPPLAQAVVILKYAKKGNMDLAQQFYKFLFSPMGQSILKQYGYGLPKKRANR